MKRLIASTTVSLVLLLVSAAFAIEQPRVIPRSHEIQRPVDDVYASMRKFFTDPTSRFKLVSEDPRTHTLIAKESGIIDEDWTRWAYCETAPMQMISKLRDGTVTVTVKLEKSTPHSTFASAAAEFEGVYGLGDNESKVACTSKFVLEDDILAAAGANMAAK
jgi:hypothetical protein